MECYVKIKFNVSFVVTPAWGGEPAAHYAGQEDAWRKILDYLKKHLYSVQYIKVSVKKLFCKVNIIW